MIYGYVKKPIAVTLLGVLAGPEQTKWAKNHESNGRYNYHVHSIYQTGKPSSEWYFELQEDAVLFALKFK